MFQIISSTKVGSIPFITIDNYEKYLSNTTLFLFSYRDLYEAQQFILQYGKGYKKYFMLPDQSNHILTMSLVEKVNDNCNKLSKAEFNITTRGGYRPLTALETITFAENAGFMKMEAFCHSPMEKRKNSKKLKIQRQNIVNQLEQMMKIKNEKEMKVEIIGAMNLTGTKDDVELLQKLKSFGIKEIVFDVEYIDDQKNILEYVQFMKNNCDLLNDMIVHVKLYSFDLEQLIQCSRMNLTVWTNAINEFTLHGQALIFPLTLNEMKEEGKENKKEMSIDLYDKKYKEIINENCMENCNCFSCKTNQSRAYIHHLLLCHELTGTTLLSLHNFHHIHQFITMINQLLDEKNEEKLNEFVAMYKELLPSPDFQKVKLYIDRRSGGKDDDDDF